MFIGQINLKDLADFDVCEKFPKTGMLYIFYDTFAHTYSTYYTKEEGSEELDGFNEKFNITGRFTSPLQPVFSEADEVSVHEYGNKLFSDIPQLVKDLYPKYKSGYRSLIVLCPKKFDYFEKAYLTGIKTYSVIAIAEKDLLKGKLENVFTLNV